MVNFINSKLVAETSLGSKKPF